MKSFFICTGIVGLVLLFVQCSSTVSNKKDLDRNMQDMMIYHDNLGNYLRRQDADYALWLLDGMDSSLNVIASHFMTHRKLLKPFKESYEKKLEPPIKEMRKALHKNDFTKAIVAYQLLTKNCNSCHIDCDVDKEVIDWSDPATK